MQELGNFVRPRVLLCKRSRLLFVCSVPETLVGGSRDRKGSLVEEILCVEMEQAFTVPKGFWWYDVRTTRFRKATVCKNLGNMHSDYLIWWCKDADGVEKKENKAVHTILMWTFLCPHGKWKHRWTDSYEADHGAEGHHVNALTNITLRHKRKCRSLSGQESARVKSVRRAADQGNTKQRTRQNQDRRLGAVVAEVACVLFP